MAINPMDVVYECLLESQGDTEAGLMAADAILSTDVHGREHKDKGPGGGQFTSRSTGDSSGQINTSKPKMDRLLKGWKRSIKIGKTYVKKVSRFIWNNVSKILDNIPGSRYMRRKAAELADKLAQIYTRSGVVGIIGTGLAVHYHKSLFSAAQTVGSAVGDAVSTTASFLDTISDSLIGLSGKLGVGAGSTAAADIGVGVGSPVWHTIGAKLLTTASTASPYVLPPAATIIGILVAVETYKYLRKRYRKSKEVENQRKLGEQYIEDLNKVGHKFGGSSLSVDSHGREHRDRGKPGAGQFVGKNRKEKHPTPFNSVSPLSEEEQKELDDLIDELDSIKFKVKKEPEPPGRFSSFLDALKSILNRRSADKKIDREQLLNMAASIDARLGGYALGMVGDEWHGPNPPNSSEWVAIAPGPKGGKRWKHISSQGDADGRGRPEPRGVDSGSDSGDDRVGGKAAVEPSTGKDEGREQTLDTSETPEPVRGSLKPEIVTARGAETPEPNISKVPESLRKYLISPDGETHQLEGAAMAISAIDSTGGFLLADGAGAGKTRQMLAIAQTYASRGKKALLVAPAGIIQPDWDSNSISGSIGKDGKAMDITLRLNRGDQAIKPGEVCVTTYESLKAIKDKIDKDTIVIFDEAHGLKNATSARSQHGRDISTKALGVVYGSATPADSVRDISYLFRTKLFGGEPWETAKERFSIKKLGAINVLRNVAEIFNKLTRDGIMVKREISLDGVSANFDHIQLPEGMKQQLEDMKSQASLPRAQLLMRQRFAQEKFKIPHAVDIINKELAEGRQVVIFVAGVGGEEGNQPGTAGMLRNALAKSGISDETIAELHGAEGGGGKEVVEAFQKGEAKVLITTAQSGGTGHNFDDVVGDTPRTQIILTPPFSAIDNSQIWGRTHRLTTKSQSRMHYVFADTEVDRWNANLIRNKMKSLNAIVGGESEKQAIPSMAAAMGLMDGRWHGLKPPSYGEWVLDTPGPRGGIIWRRIDEPGRRRHGSTDATGRGVEGTPEGTGADGTGGDGYGPGISTDTGFSKADAERITKRLDNYKKYFHDKLKYKEAAEWVNQLQNHIGSVGPEVIGQLLPEKKGKIKKVQYKGTGPFQEPLSEDGKEDLRILKNYLNTTGITFLPMYARRRKDKPLIASAPIPSVIESKTKSDIVPIETTLWSKLEESQLIPGFESSQDIHELVGRFVTRMTPAVTSVLDETYGKDKWIIKNYGDESYATFGVLFPQRLREIKRKARQVIHEASDQLKNLGYSLYRDGGIITGVVNDKDGKSYLFDSEQFGKLKNKEVKRLSNLLIATAPDENGARLPRTTEDALQQEYGVTLVKDDDGWVIGANSLDFDGNYVEVGSEEWKKLEEWYDSGSHHMLWRAIVVSQWGPEYGSDLKYFVQPAAESSAVSESDRIKGLTWETGHEGRVHATTKDGKVSIVPYATLASRHDMFPAVFYNEDIKAMEKALQDTLEAFPYSERNGQTYGSDVMKTTDGWQVIETNPSVDTAQSMWLMVNPFVIDAYVASLTNRDPAHVKFIRDALKSRRRTRRGIVASLDRSGHHHKGEGPGGGQFTSGPEVTKSKARVNITRNAITTEKIIKEVAERFLGKGSTKQDFATIVAAPDDATVTLEMGTDYDGEDVVHISVDHKFYTAERTVQIDSDEGVWIHNKDFFVKPKFQNKGIGSDIFYKQVVNASNMGVAAIYAVGASGWTKDGNTKMNGHYTWPRLGYNAPITSEHINKDTIRAIKKRYPEARTIQYLMKTEERRKWWLENGTYVYSMKFDLSPGSKSMRRMDKYLAERKARK